MVTTILDVISIVALGLGLVLGTIGVYGLLRMPDIFHQLHPNGLITGPAVILVLLASIGTGSAEIITSAVLVILFVLITAPLSSHAIAQAAHERARVGEAQE
jgi:multicomponent Na+:H+ antiporter subunit G